MPEIDEEKLLSVASEVFGDETEFYKTHCIKPLLDYGLIKFEFWIFHLMELLPTGQLTVITKSLAQLSIF